MATCPRCNKRSAKRYCPALKTKICAVCCAEERMMVLACPEGCQYLRDARTQAAERESQLRMKEVAEGRPKPEVSRRILPALYAIDMGIVAARRDESGALSDLDDREILDAVELTIKNLETEDSGLIYEHRASSRRVEEVSRRIRASLAEVMKDAPEQDRLPRADIIKVLNFARDAVATHIRRGEGEPGPPRSYIRYISLFIPWPEEATKPLII